MQSINSDLPGSSRFFWKLQSAGEAIIIEATICWAWRQCLLLAMELHRESVGAAVSLSLLAAFETHTDRSVSRRFDMSLV